MPRTRNIDKWLGECNARITITWLENGRKQYEASLNYPTEPYVPGYRTMSYMSEHYYFDSEQSARKWFEKMAHKWGKANNIVLVRDGFRIGHAA